MKKVIFILACVTVLASCGNKGKAKVEKNNYQYFGDTITDKDAIKSTELMGFMADKDSAAVKFEAVIKEVCQKKGCWMDVDLGNNKSLTVNFKDYGFFMPKDAGGKTAIMEGYCYKTIDSVEWLKHKAQDAGKPQTAIDSITKPDTTYAFTASGVIIK